MPFQKSIFALTIIVITTLPAYGVEFGVRGQYWAPTVTGDISVDAGGIEGTRLDLEDDLDIENEGFPGAEVFASIGNHQLSLGYYKARADGDATLAFNFTFNGETFTASQPISSELEYDVWDFQYRWDAINVDTILAGVSIGLIGRVQVYDGSVEIESATVNESEDFTIPIPMAGLGLNFGILKEMLEARVAATGMGYGNGTIFDGKAELAFTPLPFVAVEGGYRYFLINVDEDDIDFDYVNAGPFVGISLSF